MRGSIAVGVSQAISVLIALATVPLLADLLDREDFGIVAIVTVFTGFVGMFVDAGLAMATVQRTQITREQVTNLFWLSTSLGVVVGAAALALSPAVGWLYGEPRLASIMVVLAASFVLAGAATQHEALLRRGMQLRELACQKLACQVIGQAAGLSWAWRFQGQENDYWALVVMPVTAAAVRLLLAWALCPWRPGVPRRGVGTRSMVEFGANLTASSFSGYFARSADVLLIGWWWGESAVGLYSMAVRLTAQPIRRAINPAGSVFVPALSRLADQPIAYRRAFCSLLKVASVVLMPATAMLVVLGDWIFALFFDETWAEAAPIFQWLCIVTATQVIAWMGGWVFKSQGRGAEMLWLSLILHPTTVLAILIGLPWGITAVAAVYAISGIAIRLPITVYIVGRRGHVSQRDFLGAMQPALISLFACSAVAIACRYVFHDVAPAVGIALTSGAGFVVWAVCAYATGTLSATAEVLRNPTKSVSAPS